MYRNEFRGGLAFHARYSLTGVTATLLEQRARNTDGMKKKGRVKVRCAWPSHVKRPIEAVILFGKTFVMLQLQSYTCIYVYHTCIYNHSVWSHSCRVWQIFWFILRIYIALRCCFKSLFKELDYIHTYVHALNNHNNVRKPEHNRDVRRIYRHRDAAYTR